MALGLTGCMGQFFGKSLDKMMLLGELSLDGTVRPVRGALSATLAARENGLQSDAAAARRRHGDDLPWGNLGRFSFALHACSRDESLSLRVLWRSNPRMPLHAANDPALCFEDFRPLLDRIDIQIELPSVKYKELRARAASEDSESIRGRVIAARKRQQQRFKAEKGTWRQG